MSGDFFFGVFLFLLLRWLALLFNLLAFPRLRPRPTPPRPTASLLVPARNEAENLKKTLPALLRQGALEVLVLDDLSEDGTAQAALEAAGNHPAFHLLRGAPPPPGWTGKNWACFQLAQEARGGGLGLHRRRRPLGGGGPRRASGGPGGEGDGLRPPPAGGGP